MNTEFFHKQVWGRFIRMPYGHLLDYAGLDKDAVVIGAGNHAEIWNPADYEESMALMTAEEVEAEFEALGF